MLLCLTSHVIIMHHFKSFREDHFNVLIKSYQTLSPLASVAFHQADPHTTAIATVY